MSLTEKHPQSSERLEQLPTETRNLRSEQIDLLSTIEMLRIINDEDATIAAAVRVALPEIAKTIDAITERFAQDGRLFYVGAGTSGRLGILDASECPPTFGVSPGLFVGLIAGGDSALRNSSEGSEDSAGEGARDLAAYTLTPADTVVGIAASGRTPYVLGALRHGGEAASLTIALTCAGGTPSPSRAAQIAQIAIELATGPEVLTGSTRMKAGTATKLVLNMISTGVMIRSGAVYGNLMVNVQTTNAKLRDRAERIIAAATSADPALAANLLHQAGSVKIAILMQMLQIDRQAAEDALTGSNGSLRRALHSSR